MIYNNHSEIWKSLYHFDLHKTQNLVYPELVNPELRFLCVPLEFEIDKENKPVNINYSFNKNVIQKTHWPKVNFEVTSDPIYLRAASQVVQSYSGWWIFRSN